MTNKNIAPGSTPGATEAIDAGASNCTHIVPQKAHPRQAPQVDLLLSFKYLDGLATQAKKRGDYGAFWRLRRAALLRQAAWYRAVHAGREDER